MMGVICHKFAEMLQLSPFLNLITFTLQQGLELDETSFEFIKAGAKHYS